MNAESTAVAFQGDLAAAYDAFYEGLRAPLPAGCRGECRNCQRTFDGCINAHGDHWLPCCSRCDHP